ncbi:hypothetical protein [Rufibacter roseus]|uniref:STAS domain-containing protein n=1 Tax=Rufibacter roseus TaxID=1567108 RepID=A0ABW2DME9_9BACT|nr:hypothetical protein [Rufibacter roseus]
MQKIITEKIGRKVIIVLQGDVDASDARLSRRLHPVRQVIQEVHVWIDCAEVKCIKSTAFAIL